MRSTSGRIWKRPLTHVEEDKITVTITIHQTG
uniref:Uncharacterized protein n=1 Tax=Anguilla anguilla TaxID=7936 RepID=A0A0E9R096_ANGAN